MDVETNQEIWEVEANGQTYQTSFDEMTAWIGEGSLLRIDRVRKGNLRWIEAGKVASLLEFFNAKDASGPPPPVISTTTTEVLGVAPAQPQQFVNAPAAAQSPEPAPNVCSLHGDAPAKYICDTCGNLFCKACPNSYGGNVKICPFCGAMCSPFAEVAAPTQQTYAFQRPMTTEGFGFRDFGRAIAYPFKFKTSLILGAFMFMLFSIGQGVIGFGGMFMMFSALICFLLANTLTFGILANTVENFSQGELDEWRISGTSAPARFYQTGAQRDAIFLRALRRNSLRSQAIPVGRNVGAMVRRSATARRFPGGRSMRAALGLTAWFLLAWFDPAAISADAGLRVNGDSPLHRAVLLAEGVRLWRESGVDLVSNVPGRTWPFGWSVEVVSTAARKRAHAAMGSAEHREHVTKFLYDEPAGFSRLVLAPGPAGGSGLQLAVDDEADLARFEGLLDQWHGDLSNAAPTTVIAAALAQGCGASP